MSYSTFEPDEKRPSIEEIQSSLSDEFALLPTWEEKYEYIIGLAGKLPPLDPSLKTDRYLIKGCQSKVWLYAEYANEKVRLYADSDAIITKGLVSMVVSILNNQTAKDIIEGDLHIVSDIGLGDHLSPTRANGLVAMIKQVKLYALVLRNAGGQASVAI